MSANLTRARSPDQFCIWNGSAYNAFLVLSVTAGRRTGQRLGPAQVAIFLRRSPKVRSDHFVFSGQDVEEGGGRFDVLAATAVGGDGKYGEVIK
jgi:hypothetical protein